GVSMSACGAGSGSALAIIATITATTSTGTDQPRPIDEPGSTDSHSGIQASRPAAISPSITPNTVATAIAGTNTRRGQRHRRQARPSSISVIATGYSPTSTGTENAM